MFLKPMINNIIPLLNVIKLSVFDKIGLGYDGIKKYIKTIDENNINTFSILSSIDFNIWESNIWFGKNKKII